MNKTPTERIRAIKAEIEKMAQELKTAQAVVARCEGEMVDLEHEIELLPLNRLSLRQCAERLRDVRRERRAAKDSLETLSEIVRTLEKLGATRAIDEAIRAAEQADKTRETRQYKPRVRPEAAAANRKHRGESKCPQS